MELRNGIGALALVLVSGGGGWLLHDWTELPQPEATAAAAAQATPAAPSATPGGSLLAFPQTVGTEGDLVELHADGSASLRVQHRPPAWVLAELCRQGAQGLPGCGTAAPQASAAPAAGADTLAAPRALSSEQALVQARTQGRPLPDATLQSLMQSDPSENVRMEAFEDYVEAHSGTEEEMRAALQEVMRIPNPALQARARAQLEEMDDAARLDAETAQQQQPAGPY
ncbi:hypothetical protein [Azohydromonas caseinilytica]|uniref:Uncharacterized protein n=1 Tax=Azohydromonas caseinilytica TaxID=2728836 RepID=A0A848FIA1_9BURK|nr:hypothetical protein [Azohydromonas caseinilytica]NML18876.1 hypothetical protein [Azohydromonas caseinilytica]